MKKMNFSYAMKIEKKIYDHNINVIYFFFFLVLERTRPYAVCILCLFWLRLHSRRGLHSNHFVWVWKIKVLLLSLNKITYIVFFRTDIYTAYIFPGYNANAVLGKIIRKSCAWIFLFPLFSNYFFFIFLFYRSIYFYACTAVSLFIIALINGILLAEKNEVWIVIMFFLFIDEIFFSRYLILQRWMKYLFPTNIKLF